MQVKAQFDAHGGETIKIDELSVADFFKPMLRWGFNISPLQGVQLFAEIFQAVKMVRIEMNISGGRDHKN